MTMSSPIAVRVARKTTEALDICSLELVAVDGSALPAFSAGSHIDVQLPGGITRQYSLCNNADENHRYVVSVLRDTVSRGGSQAVHDLVAEGDEITISAPRNHFALAHDAKQHLLLAGGIGVTPILCMAERLALTRSDFRMHYCTRSKERTAFLQHILDAAYVDRVAFHFDDGDAAQKLDLAATLTAPRDGVHLYVCGPKGFMDAVLATARAQGWPEAQLHYEFFAGAVVASADDASFEVQLASSGKVVRVPLGNTLVKALQEAGA